MDGVIAVIIFCCVIGTVAICLGLIISGILRWLAPLEKREGRLNIAAWIAGTVLAGGSVVLCVWKVSGSGVDESMSILYLKMFKTLIAFLIFVIIAICVIALLFLVGLRVILGLRAIVCIDREKTDRELKVYDVALKRPAVSFMIALGVIALFLVIPFLLGEEKPNPADTWASGVYVISSFIDEKDTSKSNNGGTTSGSVSNNYKESEQGNNETAGSEQNNDSGNKEKDSSNQLFDYALIYIIVLGVGFAIVRILDSFVQHLYRKEEKSGIIDEYSNPIAVLAIGVASLWVLRGGDILEKPLIEILGDLLGAFATVIAIFAIAVLTLEIIRLLMDMREKIIRQEARYLFIFLVGQCTMMLMDILILVCGALDNSVNGLPFQKMFELEDKMRAKMKKIIDDEADVKTDLKAETHQSTDPHRTFLAFSARTKKK